MKLIDWAKEQHGRSAELAVALHVPAALVSQWVNGVREVPLERCVPIEIATGGAVTCEELRPDLVDYFAHLRRGPATVQPGVQG